MKNLTNLLLLGDAKAALCDLKNRDRGRASVAFHRCVTGIRNNSADRECMMIKAIVLGFFITQFDDGSGNMVCTRTSDILIAQRSKERKSEWYRLI